MSVEMPSGNPEALEGLADQLDNAAVQVGDLAAQTHRVTTSVADEAEWTGNAADAYKSFTSSAVRGMGAMENPLSSAASAVRSYAGALRSAQQRVAALQQYTAAGSPVSTSAAQELEQDALAFAERAATAEQHATAVVDSATSELAAAFSADGPVRGWLERLHAPWDAAGADAVLASYIKSAEQGEQDAKTAETFAKELPGKMAADFQAQAKEWMSKLSTGELTEGKLAGNLQEFTDDWDAIGKWNSGLQEAGEAAAAGGGLLRGAGFGLDGAAIVGDAFTLAKPEDAGAAGWVDRGAAGANMAAAGVDIADLAGVNMAADWIPGVGEVVGVGTGIYLGGNYLYQHWQPFHNFVDGAASTAVSAAKGIGHVFGSIF